MSTNNFPLALPLSPRYKSPQRPLRARRPHRLAQLWTWLLPVMLTMLLTSFAAHAQQPAGEARTCEVCIPADYAEACDQAAADAQTYYGEAKAMRRVSREETLRAQQLAMDAELHRREAERQRKAGWWMLAGGSAGTALVLVLVYALAN